MGSYLKKSGATIVRTYTQVKPLKVFGSISVVSMLVGLAILVRYLLFFLNGSGSGHVQSLLLGVMLFISGLQIGIFGLLADAVAANRKTNEETLYRVKKMEYRDLIANSNKE